MIKSKSFAERGKQAREIRARFGDRLDAKERVALDVQIQMADVHEELRTIAGATIDIAPKADSGLAAAIGKNDRKIFFVQKYLQDRTKAKRILKHELEHRKHLEAGIKDIDFRTNVEPHQFKVVQHFMARLGVQLEEVNWIEGITEHLTAEHSGVDCDCAYTENEVKAFKLLDNACFQLTGKSLSGAFKMLDIEAFYARIGMMGDMLLLLDTIDHLEMEDLEFAAGALELGAAGVVDGADGTGGAAEESGISRIKLLLRRQVKEVKPTLNNPRQAVEVLKCLLETKGIQQKIGRRVELVMVDLPVEKASLREPVAMPA